MMLTNHGMRVDFFILGFYRPDERARIEGLDGVVGMVDLTLDPPKVISPEKTAEQEKDLGPVRVFFKGLNIPQIAACTQAL